MMYIECLSIIVLIGIFIVTTARTGRHTAALSLLPLLSVPLFYLLSAPLSGLLISILPATNRLAVMVAATVLGLVIACVLFGMLCGNYGTRRTRRGYLVMCGGFSLILAVVLLYNLIAVLAF